MVPTVERGLLGALFCWIAIVGDNPRMRSYFGFSIWPRNCRAYADNDSTYRRCPSAYTVSNARLDLPDPDGPVITTSWRLGSSSLSTWRLCSLAPSTMIESGSRSAGRRPGPTEVRAMGWTPYGAGVQSSSQ